METRRIARKKRFYYEWFTKYSFISKAKAENVPYDVDVITWWYSMKSVLPHWYNTILPEAVI
jgi:hypothetical protein